MGRAPGARRIACVEPCAIDGTPSLGGFVWNLSTGGLYVVIDSLPEVGGKVRIAFSLTNEDKPVRAEARVAWRNPPSTFRGRGSKVFSLPPGCGLEFLVIDRADLERIEGHVRMTPVPLKKAS